MRSPNIAARALSVLAGGVGAIGCSRPRPLSPRFCGSLSVPIAVGAAAAVVSVSAGVGVGAVFLAESVAGAGVAGVAGAIGVCSVASVWAIGIATSATGGTAAFSASASALASASKQDTVASQWPRFTSEAV